MRDTVNSQPGCLGAFFRLLGIGTSETAAELSSDAEAFPYRVCDNFLSPAEAAFYRVLASVVEDRLVICPKVNLADVFFVPRPNENRGAKNRIDRKHVDFLLCTPDTLKPALGIELDDSSHTRPDRQTRDEFVEAVFVVAELPLLRVPVQRGYSPQELAKQIDDGIKPKPSGISVAATSAENIGASQQSGAQPICPKCGVPMIMRTRGRGEGAGKQFWGCSNYPRCRETFDLT